MRFDEILTNDDVLDGLWDMHFDECTPIQEQTIPSVLEGKDLLACAQTGTRSEERRVGKECGS